MSSSDDDPPLSIDTSAFFLPGSGLSALLIHGLSGTPYEMRFLGERLAAAGIRVNAVRLAGHAGTPEQLGTVSHHNWYESAIAGLEELRPHDDPVVVVGLSMGAVLAARLAIDQREAVAGLVMLAPAFYLPFWIRVALRAIAPVAAFGDRLYFSKPGGSDIHDAAARRVHPGTRLMPLRAPLNLVELSANVRARLDEVVQPTLIIHSRRDHTCPYGANVEPVLGRLGSAEKRAVTLEESFHVITVDSEKDRVADETLAFVNNFRRAAAPARALG
jgi:carboxylesterase